MPRPLFPYQNESVLFMEHCEKTHISVNPSTGFGRFCSTGILENPLGSGKTAVALQLVKNNKIPFREINRFVFYAYFSRTPEIGDPKTLFHETPNKQISLSPIPVSLVICPKQVVYEWEREAGEVEIPRMIIDVPKKINKDTIAAFIRENRNNGAVIVVSMHIQRAFMGCVSSSFIRHTHAASHFLFFHRIILDDIHSGAWTTLNSFRACGGFLWFINSTPELISDNRISDIHIMTHMIPDSIRSNFGIHRIKVNVPRVVYNPPPVISHNVYFRDNSIANALKDHLPVEVSTLLESGDFSTAYAIMISGAGGNPDVSERKPLHEIAEDKYREMIEDLRRRKISLIEMGAGVGTVDAKIKQLEESIEKLRNRVREFACESLECPICMTDIGQGERAIVKCCNNVFCRVCIGTTIHRSKKCPLCRETIGLTSLYSMDTEGRVLDMDYTRTLQGESGRRMHPVSPMEALRLIVDGKPGGRFITFAPWETTSVGYKRYMREYGIKVEGLDGSAVSIRRKIKNLEEGKIQILFMSNKTANAGLNLQFATDIVIIGSNLNAENVAQCIGRVRRFPRTEPVPVHYIQRLP